jgi:hypothetical protein
LNRAADEGDSYPIVTLAEGHISVLLRFFGVEGTKAVTQQYANELLAAHKRHPGGRLQEAVNNVVILATNGVWKEAYGPGYLDEN